MKLIIECECGNRMEVEPETYGNVAYFKRALTNNNFDCDEANIEVVLGREKVTDESDVETTLKEVRIDCRDCGRYMYLDFQ